MPGNNPLACSHAAMARRSISEIVLLDTGNYPGQSNYLNETVTWTSGNWTLDPNGPISPYGPLPLRTNFGMAFDSGSTEVIMFGGQGESETEGVLNDTWSWSGTAWAQKFPGNVPFGRYKHDLADLHGVGVLMFGGCTVNTLLEETWLWTGGAGGNWALLTPGVVPAGRTDFVMAGSTAATNVLMFGGKGTNSCFGDTWMWVGTSTGDWVLQTPAVSPPAMAECCMAYDAANSAYILFGGRSDDGGPSAQTWVWTGGNGGNWHLATPAVSPPARVGAQMAYDGSHVIMFGGYGTASNLFPETWEWTGGTGGNWVLL